MFRQEMELSRKDSRPESPNTLCGFGILCLGDYGYKFRLPALAPILVMNNLYGWPSNINFAIQTKTMYVFGSMNLVFLGKYQMKH